MSQYYVYCPNRGKPTVTYTDLNEAVAEAKRLSRKENEVFQVLEIISQVAANPRTNNQKVQVISNLIKRYNYDPTFDNMTERELIDKISLVLEDKF